MNILFYTKSKIVIFFYIKSKKIIVMYMLIVIVSISCFSCIYGASDPTLVNKINSAFKKIQG